MYQPPSGMVVLTATAMEVTVSVALLEILRISREDTIHMDNVPTREETSLESATEQELERALVPATPRDSSASTARMVSAFHTVLTTAQDTAVMAIAPPRFMVDTVATVDSADAVDSEDTVDSVDTVATATVAIAAMVVMVATVDSADAVDSVAAASVISETLVISETKEVFVTFAAQLDSVIPEI